MSNWGILTVLLPEVVGKRHYFLEEINNPIFITILRVILIVSVIIALLIYKYMRGKRGK